MTRPTRRWLIAVGVVAVAASAVGFAALVVLGFALGFAGMANGLHKEEWAVIVGAWYLVTFVVLALMNWMFSLAWTFTRNAVTSLLAVVSQLAVFVGFMENGGNAGALRLAVLMATPALAVVTCAGLWPDREATATQADRGPERPDTAGR